MEFTRTKVEEQAAQYKANDLLLNSLYSEKCRSAQLFILALHTMRSVVRQTLYGT